METRKLVLYERITIERTEAFLHKFKLKKIQLTVVDIYDEVARTSVELDTVLEQGLLINQRYVRANSVVLNMPDIEALYPLYQFIIDVDTFLVKLYRAGNLGRLDEKAVSAMRHAVVSGFDRTLQAVEV